MRPGKIAADEPPLPEHDWSSNSPRTCAWSSLDLGSDLWILDFALEGWQGGGSFAGKPRWEDALVESMKVQKWGNSGTGMGIESGIRRSTWDGNIAD